jgi:TatD DNase family protein
MVKKDFDVLLTTKQITEASHIVDEAKKNDVSTIINVGTSLIESKNCIALAQKIQNVFATIGIHPNDANEQWKEEVKEFDTLLKNKEDYKIVGVGECGIDRHYPHYNLQRQYDVFKAQIELALTHDVGLVVHSRDAYDETLRILDEYARHKPRAVMHCFSYDQNFAKQVIAWGFKLGIGGTVTYPKNDELRVVVYNAKLQDLVLETDAPYLPPQSMRGLKNTPSQIKTIADFIVDVKKEPFEKVAEQTTLAARYLFRF